VPGLSGLPSGSKARSAATRAWSLRVVFDHGPCPKIGPLFLWQVKQRTPSRICTSVWSPLHSITPKSNRLFRAFHEMNSMVLTLIVPSPSFSMFAAN
jgi:hypothetical protein